MKKEIEEIEVDSEYFVKRNIDVRFFIMFFKVLGGFYDFVFK